MFNKNRVQSLSPEKAQDKKKDKRSMKTAANSPTDKKSLDKKQKNEA